LRECFPPYFCPSCPYPQAHLEIGDRASVKLAVQEYEKLVELEPDNRTYKDGLKDAMLTWEADFA